MRKLLALVFSVALLAISIVTLLSVTRSITTPANAAPNPIEIISISELSSTSVEILFSSTVPKKSLSYFVINAVVESPVGIPKNVKKVVKTKASGLITTEIKNLNPKTSYKFTVSAKTNKAKMINSAAVAHSSLSILMDALSNLPSDWGNPKPIQIPTATPAAAPIALPAFTLSSTTESRTVNTEAIGFTTNSTGSVITSFAINATPSGMSFNITTGALTGTPNTIAAATIYTITATNSLGSVTQTFTLTVNAKATPTLSSFTNVSKAKGAPAFTLTAPTVAGGIGGAFTYISATTATATIAGATVTVVSGGTTLITATFTPNDTTEYSNATITMTLTVAYAVGNRGPGGGIVFYVSAGVFTQTGATGDMCTTNCKYLEAAPTTGPSLWTDATYVWSGNTTVEIGATASETAIGTGFANTLAIVGQSGGGNTAARAGTISRAYRGPNSLSDWFLPSKNELSELYSQSTPVGGFVAGLYWSSSEASAASAWYQRFNNGFQIVGGKGSTLYVRPVRAFGP